MSYTQIDDRAFDFLPAKFDDFHMYCWLIRESRVNTDGERVVNHSLRFISKASGWSVNKIRRFYGTLRTQKLAQIRNGKLVIEQRVKANDGTQTNTETGTNYNKYNKGKPRDTRWVVPA